MDFTREHVLMQMQHVSAARQALTNLTASGALPSSTSLSLSFGSVPQNKGSLSIIFSEFSQRDNACAIRLYSAADAHRVGHHFAARFPFFTCRRIAYDKTFS